MPSPSKKLKLEPGEADWVDGEGWISDESSFYGDDDQKAALTAQSATFSTLQFVSDQPSSRLLRGFLTSDPAAAPPRKPYNPFEHEAYHARQLDETVAEFVARLPPSTTPSSAVAGWIWIAHPQPRRRVTDEGDIASFKAKSARVLRDLENQIEDVGESSKAQATKTRMLNKARAEAQAKLLEEAARHGVRTGKWMLFPLPGEVDRVWRTVAEATADGRLGFAAKVAADEGSGDRVARLICVYTDDFEDAEDVRRVVRQLSTLGLVKNRGSTGESRGIYYKTDAYTHLDIVGDNPYGLRASLHGSRDLLK